MALDVNVDTAVALQTVAEVANTDPTLLLAGIGLIALAIFLIFFLKRVIVNTILGLVAFLVLYFMGVKLPFFATLIVSIIFGLAGVGTMLILHFFGLI